MAVYDIEGRTFEFSVKLIDFCRSLPTRDTIIQVIIRQLIRSGTSVGANVTEGRASSSKKDFINFHYHSLKSARETIYWLRILERIMTEKLLSERCNELLKEVWELANILGKIVINARRVEK